MRGIVFLILSMFVTVGVAVAQKKIPDVTVLTLDGRKQKLEDYTKQEKPFVVSFWATWCKPCNNELSEISDVYEEWLEKVDFNFLAVSIDDARSISKVKSMVNGNDWPFSIVLDQNHDLKRALNVSTIPHLFIFDSKGNLTYEHKGYVPGNEQEVIGELLEIME